MHSNDEVFAHENGHPNERVETNQSVSNSVLVLVRFISSPFSDDRTRASLHVRINTASDSICYRRVSIIVSFVYLHSLTRSVTEAAATAATMQ